MKKLVTFLCLLFIAEMAFTQANTIKPAIVGVLNYGSFYRIKKVTNPVYTVYPNPDSCSLRITVVCKSTMQYEIHHMAMNQHVDYYLSDINYVACSTIWWKKVNGQYYKMGETHQKTLCLFGLNPINCFQKL